MSRPRGDRLIGRALVVGAGNIGFATGRCWSHFGGDVAYWDTAATIREALKSRGYKALDDLSGAHEFEFFFVCVPTPTISGRFSSDALEVALRSVAEAVARAATRVTVVVRSTVPPGLSDGLVHRILQEYAPHARWALAHWPSFAREAFAFEDELSPRLVLVGTAQESPARAALEPFLSQLPSSTNWTTFREAELAKYGANLFNAVKISFFNALGAWAQAVSADPGVVAALVAEAAEANWNPGYGHRSIGQPFGGRCLPKDLDAFIALLEDSKTPYVDILRATRAVNDALRETAPVTPPHAR